MKRKFSKEEMSEKLLKNGKKLFSAKGFKDVGIREIVELTGISIGTFYNYFDSKEELFLSIYLEENKSLHDKLQKEFTKLLEEEEPIEILKELVRIQFTGFKKNPILLQALDQELVEKIFRKVSLENRKKSREQALDPFLPYINKWQEEGSIKEVKLELFFELFNTPFYILSYKEMIDEDIFSDLIDYLIESVIEGLRPKKDNH